MKKSRTLRLGIIAMMLLLAAPTLLPLLGAAPQARPDLVIKRFGLVKWGPYRPGSAVFTFAVTVTNIGTAESPAVPGMALVNAMDGHAAASSWGNGAELPALAPGASATVLIPVYYLVSDPSHMTGAAPHPFQAKADPLSLVGESNESNNTSGTIWVGSPAG